MTVSPSIHRGNEGDSTSAELLRLLTTHEDLAEFLDELVGVTARQFSTEREVLCGITQKRVKRNTVVASSSPKAQRMDEVQAGFDEGPCLEAQQTGRLIRVADVRDETRWPDYMNAVRDSGLRSILAVPIVINETARAAMNLYVESTGAFNDAEITAAQRYAQGLANVLRVMVRNTASTELAEDRRAAMESRTPISVAAGVIMTQNRCSHDQALQILKQASSHRNIKLRVLAEELLASIGQHTPTTAFDP